ncbi:YqgQ family protein [Lacticaseibacillus songhuajiangensis]|jgi:uncharacterized protein YqgQ|uniref:YqgQ family protein n=1 Tax=Lacticaseibacillus songhuajiangensis TaxID=1296539 RepID=UPI000F772D45|nr:YqgQ family protein [Lacticaseibacillus songhuajiangensis]MCI1283771.1 YqgQ family protein [Lacticaseibacillus songhuajiangensis]
MNNFNDILELLKKYGTYIHLGERLYDMELAAIEIDRLHEAGLIDNAVYARAKIVLNHEHEKELKHPLKLTKWRKE